MSSPIPPWLPTFVCAASVMACSQPHGGTDAPIDPPTCAPLCPAESCGQDDGCGAPCDCDGDAVCREGRCVALHDCSGDDCDTPDSEERCRAGCSATCPCSEGSSCVDALCVPDEQCADSCDSRGAACGFVCGNFCGSCGSNEACVEGACEPSTSCTGCSLSLRLVSKDIVAGQVRAAVVALDYQPVETEPHPRIADLRFALPEGAAPRDVRIGSGLSDAGKSLVFHEETGRVWRKLADGTHQLLVYDPSNIEHIAAGRLLSLAIDFEPAPEASISLVRREQIFAPPAADAALQSTDYHGALLVTP